MAVHKKEFCFLYSESLKLQKWLVYWKQNYFYGQLFI